MRRPRNPVCELVETACPAEGRLGKETASTHTGKGGAERLSCSDDVHREKLKTQKTGATGQGGGGPHI